jgi:hypothetical protein
VKGGKNKDYLEFNDDARKSLVEDEDEQPDDLCADALMAPEDLRLAVVTETMRKEIYNLHKEDPVAWTSKSLAAKYGMRHSRMKAVLHLMRLREETMELVKPAQLSAEEGWEALYQKHLQDPTKNTAETLSADSGLSVEKVNDILKRMKEHMHRSENMHVAEEYMQGQLEDLRLCGVDTTFQEVARPQSKLKRTYFPELFGDDDYEAVSATLRQRVIDSTKAKPAAEFPAFVRSREQLQEDALKRLDDLHPQVRRSESFMYKSKIAFRDLSAGRAAPTIIRTRTGK